MKAQQFYEHQRKIELTDNITCAPNPDYSLSFYQEIFALMEDYASHVNTSKIEKIKAEFSDELLNIAKEMYQAINFIINYDNREEGRKKDDYEVRFLYPANNLSYQKLLKARKSYIKFKRSNRKAVRDEIINRLK